MENTKLAVSFDPGAAHFGVAGVSYSLSRTGDETVELEFQKTFDIRNDQGGPDPDKLLEALDDVELLVDSMEERHETKGETLWANEYQPPLNTRSNPGLVRNNTYVEAFVDSWILNEGKEHRKVPPSAVKREFEFPRSESQYRSNKRFAMEIAKQLVKIPVNDHISDCVLNAVWCLRGSQ